MLWFPGKPSAPHDVDERHQCSHFQRLIARVHWLPCRDEERGTPISVARPRGLNLYTCISFMNRVFSSPTVSTVSIAPTVPTAAFSQGQGRQRDGKTPCTSHRLAGGVRADGTQPQYES